MTQISKSIRSYLDYLQQIIKGRLTAHFTPATAFSASSVALPAPDPDDSPLTQFISDHNLSYAEIITLLAAFAPHVDPVFFDDIIQNSIPGQGDFPQFGGLRGRNHRGFLPTAETVLFILSGNDLQKRFAFEELFSNDHLFSKQNVLFVEAPDPGEPQYSGKLVMSPEFIELFTTGKISHPRFSMDFPAEFITTELNKDDLVLPSATLKQITELENWINHHETLMNGWNMKRWIKPGYRVLFHGPPGTGKTLTALIVGKKTNRDVFRIDLSMVVSKFIGETEKNLSQLFERAKNKDWILFFDEADALFGKRTNVRDAHDKYANQEVAYLLQRIESHNGLIILASNFKSNIDDAFIRRFQSVIYFPLPTVTERLQLWTKTLPENAGLQLPSHQEINAIAKKYEITGAGIVNVVQYCCLESLAQRTGRITDAQIRAGIEREYQKEGKVL
jgi:DNA polymerase III delta prime subunit